jgi:hypothetical protein
MVNWIDSLFPELPNNIREQFRAFPDVRTAWEHSDDGVCMLRLARACAMTPRAANDVISAVMEPAARLGDQAKARMDGRPDTDPDDPAYAANHRTITDAYLAAGYTYTGDSRTEAEGIPADASDELIAARRLVADMVRERLADLVRNTPFQARINSLPGSGVI